MRGPAALLAAYDDQLRVDAETTGALSVVDLDELRLATFAGGRGFVTYGRPAADIARLVVAALDHFRADPDIAEVEWKTRGHDRVPGLENALVANGFVPDEPESIMIGEASGLVSPVAVPDGVVVRCVTDEAEVRAASAMADDVFGGSPSTERADALMRRLSSGDRTELWVAQAGSQIVCTGRLEPVRDSDFAGIWGGATRPRWRRRGIYRALTAARARSALRLGKTLINSDSTEYSRPILERSGFVRVSTTTPYRWVR